MVKASGGKRCQSTRNHYIVVEFGVKSGLSLLWRGGAPQARSVGTNQAVPPTDGAREKPLFSNFFLIGKKYSFM